MFWITVATTCQRVFTRGRFERATGMHYVNHGCPMNDAAMCCIISRHRNLSVTFISGQRRHRYAIDAPALSEMYLRAFLLQLESMFWTEHILIAILVSAFCSKDIHTSSRVRYYLYMFYFTWNMYYNWHHNDHHH